MGGESMNKHWLPSLASPLNSSVHAHSVILEYVLISLAYILNLNVRLVIYVLNPILWTTLNLGERPASKSYLEDV